VIRSRSRGDNEVMRTTGTVREFDAEQGWGVIDTPVTPGGCWVHFSAINVNGYRALGVGDTVVLDLESADQDGYVYRAVDVWPAGVETGARPEPDADPSGAYQSRFVVTSDDGTVGFDSDPEAPPDPRRDPTAT
jgi:cold shock protein